MNWFFGTAFLIPKYFTWVFFYLITNILFDELANAFVKIPPHLANADFY